VSISEVNPLIIVHVSQKGIMESFRNTFPGMWAEVLMEAHIKAQRARFCAITFFAQNIQTRIPEQIHCSGYEFSPEMKFEITKNAQPTFTDDHHTMENIFVIVA